MSRRAVVLATTRDLPEPDHDEAPTLAALRTSGLDAQSAPWEAGVAKEAELVILRSTWNYIHRLEEFLDWCTAVGERLVNPPSVVRWNADKRYLLELQRAGLPIVPTLYLEAGTRPDPDRLRAQFCDHTRAVLKPSVSAGSYLTRHLALDAPEPEAWAWLAHQLETRAMLVQPYVDSIDTYGERSLVFIDGRLTHAVRKSPRFMEATEGVTLVPTIPEDERAFAERAFALGQRHADRPLLYARVDVARDAAGAPMLMELELIEPSLFFHECPESLPHFVRAVHEALER